MDSKLLIPTVFEDFTYGNDPDQWWQPDDPEWSGTSIAEIVESLYGPLLEIGKIFGRAFGKNAQTNTGYHNPSTVPSGNYGVTPAEKEGHRFHTHFKRQELLVTPAQKDALESVMRGEPLEDYVLRVVEPLKALEPLIEVTEGHHAVCKHKPRCAKPGPGAAFNQSAASKRRPRHHR